jgi:hypothetical protein
MGGDVGFAQRIQKRGLTVIDVTHYGNHRGSRAQILRAVRLYNFLQDLFFVADNGCFRTESAGDIHCGRTIESLIDGGKNPFIEKPLDDIFGASFKFL